MCSFLVWKNACFNYRECDLEGDLLGVPHTWYLLAQSFITLLKLVWREQGIATMKELKKKCVGLQRTWVSKRTVHVGRFLLWVFIGPAGNLRAPYQQVKTINSALDTWPTWKMPRLTRKHGTHNASRRAYGDFVGEEGVWRRSKLHNICLDY